MKPTYEELQSKLKDLTEANEVMIDTLKNISRNCCNCECLRTSGTIHEHYCAVRIAEIALSHKSIQAQGKNNSEVK